MSDSTTPARRAAGHETTSAQDGGVRRTLSPDAPLRPETGSPLEMVIRRQNLTATVGALLGYVPAQVR